MYVMNKINFCYHATVQAIWFSIVWQIDNSLSRTCLNIAQWAIGIWLHFYIFVWSVSDAVFFFRTTLQFYNFRRISLWSLQTLFFFFAFFCLTLFFSWLTDFTKHFINIIFNTGTAKSATTNAYFVDIGVRVANLWEQ